MLVSGSTIIMSKGQAQPTNLRLLPHRDNPNIYMLMLKFAHTQWPALDIVDNLTIRAGATVFHGTQSARSFPFIYKDGIHYGCFMATHTDADQYALANISGSQIPCRIINHFQISVGNEKPLGCTIIQQFVSDNNIPQFPWDL